MGFASNSKRLGWSPEVSRRWCVCSGAAKPHPSIHTASPLRSRGFRADCQSTPGIRARGGRSHWLPCRIDFRGALDHKGGSAAGFWLAATRALPEAQVAYSRNPLKACKKLHRHRAR